jgi:adenine deaminase
MFTSEEALEKLGMGMKILIREEALPEFRSPGRSSFEHWENMMFCSDDKHPTAL